MIIWDDIKKEHYIRIKGNEKVRIKVTDFPLNTSKEDDQTTISQKIDAATVLSESYHAHIHIFSKPNALSLTDELSYVLWLGPVGSEPSGFAGYKWWENWPEEE